MNLWIVCGIVWLLSGGLLLLELLQLEKENGPKN